MAGKGKDINSLYISEHQRLERQIQRKVGCRNTAKDLVQDIFLRLWEKATEWQGDSAAYLTRCARNAAIDHLRAEKSRMSLQDALLPEQHLTDASSPADSLAADQQLQHIDAALAALPERTRHIFLLNRIHGRSFSEIAAAMGISSRAVAKHMARAVAACDEGAEK